MPCHAYIGTSGFSYPHWRGVFYPEGLAQRKWLEYYAERFGTVELNNTFYAMPRPANCESWRLRTPGGFRFAVKLNKLITHRKRLAGCADLLASYLDAAGRLEEKLGPVLIQLPPNLAPDLPRLDAFLALCPRNLRWAVEFRNPAWLTAGTFAVLRGHNAALCVHDLISGHPIEATADWMYLRYHGAEGAQAGCYSTQKLAADARRIRGWLGAGRDVYAYFNNDAHGHAVLNAPDLKRFCAL